ncbi:MAG: hypothetical protein ABR604_06015, partial [Jatrophihabitantaceae bacterium]
VDLTLNSNSQKTFYWGLISWAIEYSGTGSANVTNAIVDVPDTAPDPWPEPQTVYLAVYVCLGVSPCSASGSLQLEAKVMFEAGTRVATVLSWSEQR